jgi:hypothetical protein
VRISDTSEKSKFGERMGSCLASMVGCSFITATTRLLVLIINIFVMTDRLLEGAYSRVSRRFGSLSLFGPNGL